MYSKGKKQYKRRTRQRSRSESPSGPFPEATIPSSTPAPSSPARLSSLPARLICAQYHQRQLLLRYHHRIHRQHQAFPFLPLRFRLEVFTHFRNLIPRQSSSFPFPHLKFPLIGPHRQFLVYQAPLHILEILCPMKHNSRILPRGCLATGFILRPQLRRLNPAQSTHLHLGTRRLNHTAHRHPPFICPQAPLLQILTLLLHRRPPVLRASFTSTIILMGSLAVTTKMMMTAGTFHTTPSIHPSNPSRGTRMSVNGVQTPRPRRPRRRGSLSTAALPSSSKQSPPVNSSHRSVQCEDVDRDR
ncbi:hypothetical protein R3P38DRAFT_1113288 [Favolaschia claudopus]|uniref:Uncharacterized protein n=1 Tax=Favolaschia claudopus TaxID=2862362 RepID=A0AAW0B891_9AGAR